MIKIDDGHFRALGKPEEIIHDLVILLLTISNQPALAVLLKAAEAEAEKLVEEGKYVPDNSSDKS